MLPWLFGLSTKALRFCLLEGRPEWKEAFQFVLHVKIVNNFLIEWLLKEAFNNRLKYLS